ncbi:DUF7310 family coiled-coil domain-containing protein [Halospeciosus flavus]|uniref:DUF7310 domain-containing protein n=1 Tax=Halospeciosus flavus TaxID=3032283 RepID=A0ABD5Z6L3_9EURY|nr:hypothetical protein [Halospeciosus flavus]
MSDDSLDASLRAVERQCTGAGEHDGTGRLIPTDHLVDLDARLSDAERRLDAAVQSVRGYVGALDHVNEEVERRADAALAVAERLDEASEGPCVETCAERRPKHAAPSTDDAADTTYTTHPPKTSGSTDNGFLA